MNNKNLSSAQWLRRFLALVLAVLKVLSSRKQESAPVGGDK